MRYLVQVSVQSINDRSFHLFPLSRYTSERRHLQLLEKRQYDDGMSESFRIQVERYYFDQVNLEHWPKDKTTSTTIVIICVKLIKKLDLKLLRSSLRKWSENCETIINIFQ